MNIGIICGGRSDEHEISIISALEIYKKMKDLYFIYLDKNNNLFYYKKPSIDKILNSKGKKYKDIKSLKDNLEIDIFILSVHGRNIEDGTLSAVLDFYNIPYVGTHLEGSLISMDKELTDLMLVKCNLPSLKKVTYHLGEEVIINKFPVIIKPARSGSSLGISVVRNNEELNKALNIAYKYDSKIIIEEYLENFKEYSIALYKENLIYYSKIEIIESRKDFFDYDEKYKNRTKEFNHVYLKDREKIKIIKELSETIYNKFELDGIVRIDFLDDGKQIYVNEVNSIPGALANYMFEDFIPIIKSLIKNVLYKHYKKAFNLESVNREILLLNMKK